jgi:hypothetical protein
VCLPFTRCVLAPAAFHCPTLRCVATRNAVSILSTYPRLFLTPHDSPPQCSVFACDSDPWARGCGSKMQWRPVRRPKNSIGNPCGIVFNHSLFTIGDNHQLAAEASLAAHSGHCGWACLFCSFSSSIVSTFASINRFSSQGGVRTSAAQVTRESLALISTARPTSRRADPHDRS